MKQEGTAIHWFGQDLRTADNPALAMASQYSHVLPIYIMDEASADEASPAIKATDTKPFSANAWVTEARAMGSASKLWLHHSLHALSASLDGALSIYRGNPIDVLTELVNRLDVKAIYWSRRYEPWCVKREAAIKEHLSAMGIKVESANGSLLWEPRQVHKDDGTPYKVFTPFYRRGCLRAAPPREPIAPPGITQYRKDTSKSLTISQLKLLPTIPWHKKLEPHWSIGEAAAHECFRQFIQDGLPHYKEGRDIPSKPFVSRLSPYLHFGEVSPNQLWYGLRSIGDNKNIEHFCSELAWREFSYSQLYYNPTLPTQNLQPKFEAFPWVESAALLSAWQQGKTGIPMVDAGMRELYQTGYMHNRVRMVAGSFLVKNLRLHWHHGERWFWDTLVDADLANNSASWQWVAGCGADAAPYFRIFNPETQGKRFDPEGSYIRAFIPELDALSNKYIFSPWKAPSQVLQQAGITLGKTYPAPCISLKQSREDALTAFRSLRP